MIPSWISVSHSSTVLPEGSVALQNVFRAFLWMPWPVPLSILFLQRLHVRSFLGWATPSSIAFCCSFQCFRGQKWVCHKYCIFGKCWCPWRPPAWGSESQEQEQEQQWSGCGGSRTQRPSWGQAVWMNLHTKKKKTFIKHQMYQYKCIYVCVNQQQKEPTDSWSWSCICQALPIYDRQL